MEATRARIAATVYGAAALLFGLAMIFVGAALTQTHAAAAAVFFVVPGLLYIALAPAIALGLRWAMVAAFAFAALAGAAHVYNVPADWWLALPIPAAIGLLTAVALAVGANARTPAGLIAEIYAASALLGALVAVMLLGLRIADRGGFAFRLDASAFGVVFAILSVFVLRGSRSAMVALALLGLALAILMNANEDATRQWIAAGLAIAFGVLTVLALVAGGTTASAGGISRTIAAEAYAAVVYLYGAAVVFAVPATDLGRVQLAGPRWTLLCVAAAGVVFAVLAAFIWRGRLWAMIAALALATLLWLVLASLHSSFWFDPAWFAAPAVFGVFTAMLILEERRTRAESRL